MRLFDYVFYCHYLLFDWMKKRDFPEVKAVMIMATGTFCLVFALLLASGTSGYFFRLWSNAGVVVGVQLLLILSYYHRFIRKAGYVPVVKRFATSRSHHQARDRTFAGVWAVLSHGAIFIYLWFRND